MPNTTAVGVLSIFTWPVPTASKMALTIPLLESRSLHARMRSIKFIHIGRMNKKTTKLW